MSKWRLLFAAIVCVLTFAAGLALTSAAAMLMNQVSLVVGLLVLVIGLGLGAIVAAWSFEQILWRS